MLSHKPVFPREWGSQAEKGNRRMNAFLIFCQRERGSVRREYPYLRTWEVTRVLSEWWSTLHPSDKTRYSALAQQHKENLARQRASQNCKKGKMFGGKARKFPVDTQPVIIPGKLADESQLGGLTSLLISTEVVSLPERKPPLSIPIKKRYREGTFTTQVIEPLPIVVKEEEKTERVTPTSDTTEDEERLKIWRTHILEENNNVKDRPSRACKGLRYRDFMWNNYTTWRRTNRWELNQDKNEFPFTAKQKTAKSENKTSMISTSSCEEKADSSRESLADEPPRKLHKKITKKKSATSKGIEEDVKHHGSNFFPISDDINIAKDVKNGPDPITNGITRSCDNITPVTKSEDLPAEANNNTPAVKNGKEENCEVVVTGSRKRKVRKQGIRRLPQGSTLQDIDLIV